MADDTPTQLAAAAQALLAGDLAGAQDRYTTCAEAAPAMAALGLAIVAWLRGDVPALRAEAARALAAAEGVATFPRGFATALEGLARVHVGELSEGLARQVAGLEEARHAGDGAELNATMAIADALLHAGRWTDARRTLEGVRPLMALSGGPLAALMLDRLQLALAVLTEAPDAGTLADAAMAAARARGDQAGLAWAQRWRGAWLAPRRMNEAGEALNEALAIASRTGQRLLAAEAGAMLAKTGPAAERGERLAAARQAAADSGSVLAELEVASAAGGATARAAAVKLEALLAPLDAEQRSAFLAWPGREGLLSRPDDAGDVVERLSGMLAAIVAQPDLPKVLQTALAAFVRVAEAERGFLLRMRGFEVLDQVIQGARPDSYSTSLADRVVWSGEPLVVEDLEADAELSAAASIQALGLRTALGVPLVSDGEVIGVMLADSRDAHPGLSAGILAQARAIADLVVVAVRNAEQAEALRAARDVDAGLARAALAAAGAAGLDQALPAIAAEAAALLGAERLFIHVGPNLACRAAVDAQGRPLKDAAPSMGAVRWVAEHGAPLLRLDVQDHEVPGGGLSVQNLQLRAVMAAPLLDGGVLYLDSRAPDGERPAAARALAGLAAVVSAILGRDPS